MDLSNLSSNWKKLQATLRTAKNGTSTVKTAHKIDLKRKWKGSDHPVRKSTIEVRKAGKRQRVHKSMTGTKDSVTNNTSVKELETAENAPRPRFSATKGSDKVNAGQSAG
jgi:hypothetical protein